MRLSTLVTAVLAVSSVSATPFSDRSAFKKKIHTKLSNLYQKRELNSSSYICSTSTPDQVSAPSSNVWAQLSDEVNYGVYTLLTDKFNLTAYENATLFDNYIAWIETLKPNKTQVLSYLDADGDVPSQYAKAVVFFGGEDFYDEEYPDGYWQTYQVGPLPVSNDTIVQPLSWWNAKDKVGYTLGYQDDHRWDVNVDFITSVFQDPTLKPIIEDIAKTPAYGSNDSVMDIWWTDPLQWDEEEGYLFSWAHVFGSNDYDADDILGRGLYFKANITGREASGMSIISWFYDNTLYNSTGEFIDAYENGEITILDQTNLTDSEWTNPSYTNGSREFDDKLPPVQVEPNGRRWTYNETERYFTWMDWELYTSWSRDQGLTLFDVKFKGERILYELGLQEAIAEYSGDDPFQMNTVFLDSSYGFGNEAWGLIPGYDCPYNAEFFNVSWHSFGYNNYQNNSYCAYEFSEDYPISRHTSSSYITSERNPTFVLRTVVTIGNYDYNFSYKFFIDGTIEVSVRAAGFIQGSYYVNDNASSPFGFKIAETLSGSFHDHVLNFKADLDIGGVNNTIANYKYVQKEHVFPWAPGKTYNTKQKERHVIETEDDSKLTWPSNGAGALLVESSTQNNSWGSPRAYRIVPGASPVHRIVNESVTLVNQAQWANNDVSFTLHKDSEPLSTNVFNAHDIYDPTVKFDDFFDGESLVGQDVVAWINLGLHHLPNTQDVPITIFNTAQSNFILTPFNYFDRAQIGDVKQQVFYRYDDDSWEFFGSEYGTCDVPIEELSYEAFNYDGLEVSKDTTNYPSP